MKKIKLQPIDLGEFLKEYFENLFHGKRLPNLKLFSENHSTEYEVVIEIIDAKIWKQPPSFFNNSDVEKELFLYGWINTEKREKFLSTASRECKIIYNNAEEFFLQKRRK